jgi:DNA-directed RNA polymerase subunit K/omega
MHAELLTETQNKYDLVLKVARRAKQLRDEIQREGTVEVIKPIPLAINELVNEQNAEQVG